MSESSPTNNQRSATMSDVRETAGMEVNADNPAPFVPTWGPEWEYVANHGTVFTFLLDDKSDVAPIKLACEFGDVWFSRDGAAAFGASWAIVSQRPRTPAPFVPKSSPKDRSPCCGASVSHVLMCDHCANEFLPETPAPSQPADVPQESAELTELRERLAGAERECSKRGEWLDEIGEMWHEITDKLTARLSAAEAERDEARAEVERLKAELEREEREHGNTIDHRDQHEESINLICDALGMDEAEVTWSSHNDPPTNAVRRIEKLFDEVANWKSEAERNGLFELRQVEEREAIKKAVGFEEIGPALPEHCRLLVVELATLRERLAGAEERIAAVREIVEQVKLSALKQADYEYAATMLNLRDCLDHGNAIDLDRLTTLLPSASRFVSSRAKEKQIDELHERVKFFDDELDEMSSQLAAVTAERDEARAAYVTVLKHCRALRRRLRDFQHHVDDEKHPVITALRSDLARAMEDGERMRSAIQAALNGKDLWLIDHVEGNNEQWSVEAAGLQIMHDQFVAALAPRAAGAEGNHIADAGEMVAELRRQKLEAHMRGDLNTADRLAALIGDKLPSKFEKDDLKAQHEEGGE